MRPTRPEWEDEVRRAVKTVGNIRKKVEQKLTAGGKSPKKAGKKR